ncbi:MAG: acyltransferase family protein, partial [Stellaceae bacterium]
MTRRNNFDALRLLAAVSVMFSHAFLIAEGTQQNEWLIRLTGNQSILGLCGVFVFFAISGFLVTQSFETTRDPLRFLAKRGLRIFPGLFVAAIVSAFVLAPLVTTLEPGAYFSQAAPYRYVVGNTLLDQRVHELPGVMFVNNPVGLEINGSMWTLRFEFMMYLMVLALGLFGLLRLPVILTLLALGMACLRLRGARFSRWMGLAARLFRGRDGALQAAPNPSFRWPRGAAGACRPRPQREAGAADPAVSAVRLLSRAVAGAQPAPSGNPGGTSRRLVIWPIHLWLAGRGGGGPRPWRSRLLVAGARHCLAGDDGARLFVLASGRAPGAA